jgi:glycosyltransferase involved in cell wall biosynthesis
MKKILLRAPILTRSGYGEHARFVLNSLTSNPEYDVYVEPLNWGQTNWIFEDTDYRKFIDSLVAKFGAYQEGPFDICMQVTIPNEWKKSAKVNIGVCAGIETDRVAPVWLQKANEMDGVIVTSNHARSGFVGSSYTLTDEAGQAVSQLTCNVPVEVVHYGVKDVKPAKTEMGPRKNLGPMVKWFAEEFHKEEVGFVVKANITNNSGIDRIKLKNSIESILKPFGEERKCKVHLIHGNMSDEEVHSLYVDPKVKAYVTATHGEGFGLPIFEAAYSGLPVVAPAWSGHVDFLYAPVTNPKSKKTTVKPLFEKVAFDIKPVPQEAHWDGVITTDSNWCFPKKDKFQKAMRNVYEAYNSKKSQATQLQDYLKESFNMNSKYQEMVNAVETFSNKSSSSQTTVESDKVMVL